MVGTVGYNGSLVRCKGRLQDEQSGSKRLTSYESYV